MTADHTDDVPPADGASLDSAPPAVDPDPTPDTAQEPTDEPAKPRRGRPKGAVTRKTNAVELTLTVSGTADGDWHAELRHGSTWITRGLPISATAVLRAAKELHDDLANPITEVIQAARSQHEARVAALEAELEQARKTLADLVD